MFAAAPVNFSCSLFFPRCRLRRIPCPRTRPDRVPSMPFLRCISSLYSGVSISARLCLRSSLSGLTTTFFPCDSGAQVSTWLQSPHTSFANVARTRPSAHCDVPSFKMHQATSSTKNNCENRTMFVATTPRRSH